MAGWLDGDGMIRCLCAVIYIQYVFIYTYVWIHVEQVWLYTKTT